MRAERLEREKSEVRRITQMGGGVESDGEILDTPLIPSLLTLGRDWGCHLVA